MLLLTYSRLVAQNIVYLDTHFNSKTNQWAHTTYCENTYVHISVRVLSLQN